MIPVMIIFRKSNKIPLECQGWHISVKQEKKQSIRTNQDAAIPEYILTHTR
jgi:hypothetical protein